VNFQDKKMRITITCIEPMSSSSSTTTKPTPTMRRRTKRTTTRSIVSGVRRYRLLSRDRSCRRYRGVDATPLTRRRATRCNDVGVVIPFASSASGSFEAIPPERNGGDDNDVGGGDGGFFSKCILWLQKQVQNARNAAPLLKWPDAVLLSKQTARDVTRNAVVILIGLCVFTAMLGCIDWCIVAFRAWLLK